MMVLLMDLLFMMIVSVPIILLILKFVDKFSVKDTNGADKRFAIFCQLGTKTNKVSSQKLSSMDLTSK